MVSVAASAGGAAMNPSALLNPQAAFTAGARRRRRRGNHPLGPNRRQSSVRGRSHRRRPLTTVAAAESQNGPIEEHNITRPLGKNKQRALADGRPFLYVPSTMILLKRFLELEGLRMSLYIALTIDDPQVVEQLAGYQTTLKRLVSGGDWVDPSTFHVTIDYLGDGEDDFTKVVRAMRRFERLNVLRNQYVFARGVHRFDGGAMWIGMDQSLKLYQLRYALRELMAQEGYHHRPDDFPEYTPHITMAFNTPDEVPVMEFGAGVAVPVRDVVLWNSPKCNGAYIDNALCAIHL